MSAWDREPIIEEHDGLLIVRDDLLPGGTKARFVASYFMAADEVVYASPAEGGMQLALAYMARTLGRRVTIFTAGRQKPHPRTLEASRAGAQIIHVRPGYLTVVQARAKAYAEASGAYLVPFGGYGEDALIAIAAAAARAVQLIGYTPPEVWCAAGSGTLSRALQAGIPGADHFAVRIGAAIEDAGDAFVVASGYRFEQPASWTPPFPSCPHYDAKAYEIALHAAEPGSLFWNVLGPSPTQPIGWRLP